jgi:serine protease Do
VTQPTSGAPADKAGIKSGDVITQVDGQDVKDALDLSRTIAGKAPGSTVDLTVWRNGQETHVKVALGTLNENAQANNSNDNQKSPNSHSQSPTQTSVGLTLVPNSSGPGVLIQDIDQNSVAASKGFAVGDTILEVDNKAVSNGQDFENAIKAVKSSGRNTALIKAERNGQVRFIGLPLDSSTK